MCPGMGHLRISREIMRGKDGSHGGEVWIMMGGGVRVVVVFVVAILVLLERERVVEGLVTEFQWRDG
jgi:uncharacterized protein (UPF0179 family)